MTIRSRIAALKPSTLLIITAVLFALTVGWTVWRAEQAEDTAKATAKEEVDKAEFKVEKQADRITVLEEYVTLCREQPKECQEEVPPVEEIEPQVTQPTVVRRTEFAQVMAAVRILLPAGISQFCADDRCDGDKGDSIKGDPGQSITGPKGDPGESIVGPKGDPGANAPTITAITCTGMTPTTFTYTFSDGTELVVECQMLPPVEDP